MQEVDVAIVADVGTLQRLPHIVGQGSFQHEPSSKLQCFVWLSCTAVAQQSTADVCMATAAISSAHDQHRSALLLCCPQHDNTSHHSMSYCIIGIFMNAGVASELALTARVIKGDEAKQVGLVSQCFQDEAALMQYARKTAELLASKSPLAVVGTKRILVHAR